MLVSAHRAACTGHTTGKLEHAAEAQAALRCILLERWAQAEAHAQDQGSAHTLKALSI